MIYNWHATYKDLSDKLNNLTSSSNSSIQSVALPPLPPSSSSNFISMLPAHSKQSGLDDIIGELHNREKRRSNIVISGLAQSSAATDKELTEVILKELKVTATITQSLPQNLVKPILSIISNITSLF